MRPLIDEITLGDTQALLPEIPGGIICTIHTSPPYNIGKEYSGYSDSLPREDYLDFIRSIVQQCFRVLKNGGSFFWQTGYTQEEDGFIFPLDHLTQDIFLDAGFKLRDRIIWRYFGGMSFKKKFTNKHETVLWWVKPGAEPYFDVFPIREKAKEYDYRNNMYGRNPGNVWEVDRVAFGSMDQTSHIAVFPEVISDRIILSTTKRGEICLDPFSGSGTLCKVAKSRSRKFIGFEILPAYYEDSQKRLSFQQTGELFSVISAILKNKVFETEGTQLTTRRMATGIKELLLRHDEKRYREVLGTGALSLLRAFKDSPIEKKDKVKLWKATDDFFSNPEFNSDPLRLVDEGFLQSYKLHKEFNGAMRFALALRWYKNFKALTEGDEGILTKTLRAIANEEKGSYLTEGQTITLINTNGRVKLSDAEKEEDALQLF